MDNIKKYIRIICVVMVFCFAFSLLSSCANRIKVADAKADLEAFFEAITAEDYQMALAYLHPSHPGSLELVFDMIELREGIDFQESVVIEKYTKSSTSAYNSDVDGARCTLVANASVGGVPVVIELSVVDNKDGKGIYDFVVYKDK